MLSVNNLLEFIANKALISEVYNYLLGEHLYFLQDHKTRLLSET